MTIASLLVCCSGTFTVHPHRFGGREFLSQREKCSASPCVGSAASPYPRHPPFSTFSAGLYA
jgi:hypothetical protein